jgi:hypothetical protein
MFCLKKNFMPAKEEPFYNCGSGGNDKEFTENNRH